MKKDTIVQCTTQEEWDVIAAISNRDYFSGGGLKADRWREYDSQSCIRVDYNCFGSAKWYNQNSYTIISYQDFMGLYPHLNLAKDPVINNSYPIF